MRQWKNFYKKIFSPQSVVSFIEVAAGIEAFDRIDLSAKDDLTLLAGSILSGINGEKARKVYLRAGGDMILAGTIHAEKLSVRYSGC